MARRSERPEFIWACGLFEGEGSACVYTSGQCVVQLATTDRDVLERFVEAVGVGSIHGPHDRSQQGWKPLWKWSCPAAEMEALLLDMTHWMGARRREQFDEVIVRRQVLRSREEEVV